MRKLNFRTRGCSADVDDRAYQKILQISICTLLINVGFSLTRRGGDMTERGRSGWKKELGL